MDYISIIGIGIGLSMDAFAAALSCGAADSKVSLNKTLKISLSFGIFQALMPFIGWIAGKVCADFIGAIDHYIAFILLGWIGGKMIYDSLIKKEDDENSSADLSLKSLMLLAVATSIDALVTGIILLRNRRIYLWTYDCCNINNRINNLYTILYGGILRKSIRNAFKK